MTPASKDAADKAPAKSTEGKTEGADKAAESKSPAVEAIAAQKPEGTPEKPEPGEVPNPVDTDPLHNPQAQEQGDPRDGAPPALTDQNGVLPVNPEEDEVPEGHTKVEVLEDVQHTDAGGSFRLRTGEFQNLPDETAKKLIKAGQVKKA